MTTSETVRTFSDAVRVLSAHGYDPPISLGSKQWLVGAMRLDKGGVIALARDLIDKEAAKAKAPPGGVSPLSNPALDDALIQLRGAGYDVKRQGMHWLTRPPSGDAGVMTHAELITLAEQLPAPTGALSTALQECARRYVAAREQAGQALLDMARAIADARQLTKHGEWHTFLESIGTGQDQAERLLNIHELAASSSEYADAIRRNFLNPTTAALLARPSTPPDVVAQALSAPEPPASRQIEQQIRDSKFRSAAEFEAPPDFADVARRFAALDYRIEQTGADRFTIWPPGRTVGIGNSTWASIHDRLAVQERLAAEKRGPVAVVPAALNHDVATLTAHGWHVGLTGDGEYRLRHGDDAYYATDADGVKALARLVVERPEATPDELAAAVSALDEEKAPDFADMVARFATLGWSLELGDGSYWLTNPAGRVYATTPDLAPHLRTLTTFEAATQQRVADGLPPPPTRWEDGQATVADAAARAIPPDIAALASAYALTIEVHPEGLFVYWPGEDLEPLDYLTPDEVREWLTTPGQAGAQVVERAEEHGWIAQNHKDLSLVFYRRQRDGKETAEYADVALAAGEALQIDQAEAARAPRCACGQPSVGKRNIGGELADRCETCTTNAERADLRAQLGAEYRGATGELLDGRMLHRLMDGNTYTYEDALTLIQSSNHQLYALKRACERAEALGATVNYLDPRHDNRVKVIAPPGHQQAELWCNAAELARLCDAWEQPREAPPVAAELPAAPALQLVTDEALAIWMDIGELLITQPAALLEACRTVLEDLVDNPALGDEIYEDLLSRFGQARRQLDMLAVDGPAPTLAEVAP